MLRVYAHEGRAGGTVVLLINFGAATVLSVALPTVTAGGRGDDATAGGRGGDGPGMDHTESMEGLREGTAKRTQVTGHTEGTEHKQGTEPADGVCVSLGG